MPAMNKELFGRKPRTDNKPGHRLVTATTQKFAEIDSSDVRMQRVRVYDAAGNLEHSYLKDSMGVRFKDNLDAPDDPDFVENLIKAEQNA